MGKKMYNAKSMKTITNNRKLEKLFCNNECGLNNTEESQVTHAKAIIDIAAKVTVLEGN